MFQDNNTSYENMTGFLLESGNFTAGEDYLLIYGMTFTNPNDVMWHRMMDNITEIPMSESGIESSGGAWQNFQMWAFLDDASGEDVYMQFKTEGTTVTNWDDMTFVAIEISELTENTDWYYNTVGTDQDLTSAYETDGASITFTPTTAGDKWLIWTKSIITIDSVANSYFSRINVSGNFTDVTQITESEGEDLNEQRIVTQWRVWTLNAEEHTFREETAGDGTNGGIRIDSEIIIINLENFLDVTDGFQAGNFAVSGSTSWQDPMALDNIIDPTNADGDFLILYESTRMPAGSSRTINMRMQGNNADLGTGTDQTGDNRTFQPMYDEGDEPVVQKTAMINLPLGTYTVEVEGDMTTCCSINYRESNILGLSMELSGASSFVENITDELGMEETATYMLTGTEHLDEELGMEDSINVVANNIYQTDELGLEDSFEFIFGTPDLNGGCLGSGNGIPHCYLLSTENFTTTSSSYANITNMRIDAGNFTSGRDYLLIAESSLFTTGGNDLYYSQLVHGTTPFPTSQLANEYTGNELTNRYVFWTVWTAAADEDVYLQWKTDGGATLRADDTTLTMIEISEELTENTDWYFIENATDQVVNNAGFFDGAHLEFTPVNDGEDWLILFQNYYSSGSLTQSYHMRVNTTGTFTTLFPDFEREGENSAELEQGSFVRTYTLDNTLQEFTIQDFSSGSTTWQRNNSKIFALNLDVFANHDYYHNTDVAPTTVRPPFYNTEIGNIDFPVLENQTGDYLIFYSNTIHAWLGANIRLQNNGTDVIEGTTDGKYFYSNGQDDRDEMFMQTTKIQQLEAGTHDFDMDASHFQGNARQPKDRNITIFSLELADSGGSNTKSFTDELGIEDSLAETHSVSEAFIDEVGLEDVTGQTTGFIQSFTDEVGLDEIFSASTTTGENFTDELGLEDSLDTVGSFNQAFTDELGIDDSIGISSSAGQSFTDELGLEDSFDETHSVSESFTDEMGLDEIFAFMAGATIILIDELGMEDSIDGTSSFRLTFTDEMGIDDSIQIQVMSEIMLVDELGLEDSFAFQVGVIYFTDELGMMDTLDKVDPLGLRFNAIMLSLNSPEFDRLGGSFAIICPNNSTLTALLTNGTFVCTPMSDFFP